VTVQARVLRRVVGLVATRVIEKGEVLTGENMRMEERWVDRKVATWLGKAEDVMGWEAMRPVAGGSALDGRDFRPLDLAARGDLVTVYFVASGLRVKSSGRALESGRLHDRIGVRNETTGEKYEGTLIGKRLLAVGPVDEKMEKQLRETR
jgi:flagella basal body P-ring formation protein FlgA